MASNKVSVCIPVYGVEKYIERCVRTLFGQTLQEIEYIFVDDCSPDRSVEIMQQVAEEFPHRKGQVKIIRHEINQGVGAARNHAVAACTGEYVIHCDPDDWVELDMYETMYNKAKETDADMVYCSYVYEYPDGKKFYKTTRFCNEARQFLNLMYSSAIPGYLVNKLYKKEIALHESVDCPDDIIMCEDHLRNTFMLPLCKKIIGMEDRFYHYRKNPNSCCNTNNREWILKKFDGIRKIVSLAEKSNAVDYSSILAYKCFALEMLLIAGNCPDAYAESYSECKKNIFAINIPLKLKMVLVIANISYSLAHWLRCFLTKLKEFCLKIFG